MRRRRYMPLRQMLRWRGKERRVLNLAARLLGYRDELPEELREAFFALEEQCPRASRERLVLIPCFTVLEDAHYPGATVYRYADLNAMAVRIGEYEALAPKPDTRHPVDGLLERLTDMHPKALEILLEKGRALPPAVDRSEIRDPLGVYVDGPTAGAFLIAWILADSWKKSSACLPKLCGDVSGNEPTPGAVYEAISRYKALSVSAIDLRMDGVQIPEAEDALCESLDEDLIFEAVIDEEDEHEIG